MCLLFLTQLERTFIAIKPDGVQRGLVKWKLHFLHFFIICLWNNGNMLVQIVCTFCNMVPTMINYYIGSLYFQVSTNLHMMIPNDLLLILF